LKAIIEAEYPQKVKSRQPQLKIYWFLYKSVFFSTFLSQLREMLIIFSIDLLAHYDRLQQNVVHKFYNNH